LSIRGRLYASPPRIAAVHFRLRPVVADPDSHQRVIIARSWQSQHCSLVCRRRRSRFDRPRLVSDPGRWIPAETIQRASRRNTPAIDSRTVMWANGPVSGRVHEARMPSRPCASECVQTGAAHRGASHAGVCATPAITPG
jgi:hypothetical protein